MGITYEELDDSWDGGIQRRVILRGTFDNNYTAGGEPIEPSDAGLSSISSITIEDIATESGHIAAYRRSDGTIKLYNVDAGTLSELTGGSTAADGDTVDIIIHGRS